MAINTNHVRFHTLGTLLMIFGTAVGLLGTEIQLNASLTEQGAYLGTIHASEPMLIVKQTVFPAAMENTGPSFGMIALGMLIVLAGIGFHGLYILRCRDAENICGKNDRNVPIKIRKQTASLKEARSSRRQAEVIWIERTIRF